MKQHSSALLNLCLSMLIFGSIGLFVGQIPLPSSVIAMIRGFIGAPVVLAAMLLTGRIGELKSLKAKLLPLVLSGTVMGLNWLLLFEAYKFTGVSVATVCYYMAPVFLVAASPLLFKEKLGGKKLLCLAAALLGMLLITLQSNSRTGLRGVLLALTAALFYATVISANKLMGEVSPYARTFLQLLTAALVLLPYNLLSGNMTSLNPGLGGGLCLLALGLIHTGFAYFLYFGAMDRLSAQTIGILSYIDPLSALVFSALLLHESLSATAALGALLILGAAFISEFPAHRKKS